MEFERKDYPVVAYLTVNTTSEVEAESFISVILSNIKGITVNEIDVGE